MAEARQGKVVLFALPGCRTAVTLDDASLWLQPGSASVKCVQAASCTRNPQATKIMVNDWLCLVLSGISASNLWTAGAEVAMESRSDTGKRHSTVSDAELLRRIGHDLRSLYSEVIRQPLPRSIEAALSRIERQQHRTEYHNQRLGV